MSSADLAVAGVFIGLLLIVAGRVPAGVAVTAAGAVVLWGAAHRWW